MQRKILYFIGFFLLLVAICTVAYYFIYNHQMKAGVYNQKSRDTLQTFYTGDYEIAAQQLRELIADAPNKSEKGRLQLLLAASLSKSENNEDRVASVKIYKDIVNDYSIPPIWRALALNNIAFLVNGRDVSFYKLYFPESPYSSYLPTAGSDVSRVQTAYFNILKASDEIYPNSFAEYSIAGNYYVLLTAMNNSPLEDIKGTYELIQKYVEEGDSRKDANLYSPSMLVTSLYFRALAINESGRELGNIDTQTREDAFKLVLTAVSESGSAANNPDLINMAMLTRWFYADFLNGLEENRDSDIITLLSPFSDLPSEKAPRMFLSSVSGSDVYNIKKRSLSLAAISPEFKKFTERIGIK